MTVKKRFEISVIAGVIFSLLLSFTGFEASCSEIRDSIFRIHIIANSDSDADQELKIKVKDSLTSLSAELFKNAQSKEEAIKITDENKDLLKTEAEKVIAEEGFNYPVTAEVGKSYFGTRVYDNFTLPAGYYDSLKIKIGKATGKNWWCVLYPTVCFSACSDFGDAVSEKSEEIITNPENYTVKFKVVEIVESAKEKFNLRFFK